MHEGYPHQDKGGGRFFLSINYLFSLRYCLHSLFKSLIYNYLNGFSFTFIISETTIIIDCKQMICFCLQLFVSRREQNYKL